MISGILPSKLHGWGIGGGSGLVLNYHFRECRIPARRKLPMIQATRRPVPVTTSETG
jgi:hypothetical protein